MQCPQCYGCLRGSLRFAALLNFSSEAMKLFYSLCLLSIILVKVCFCFVTNFYLNTFENLKNLPDFHNSHFLLLKSCFWMCLSAHACFCFEDNSCEVPAGRWVWGANQLGFSGLAGSEGPCHRIFAFLQHVHCGKMLVAVWAPTGDLSCIQINNFVWGVELQS